MNGRDASASSARPRTASSAAPACLSRCVPHAQKVIAIEQQMLMQDARMGELDREREQVRDRQRTAGIEQRAGTGSDPAQAAGRPPKRRRRRRPRH